MPVSQINSNSLASGVPASANMPAGSVLQVVTSNFASVFSTTSSGLTSTGHSVTITPKFATSKIYVINTALVSTSNQNSWGYFSSIYRGATNLATNAGGVGTPAAFAAIYSSSTASATQTITMQYLDSPATTSATTYTIYLHEWFYRLH
jgi:hypothetical protein